MKINIQKCSNVTVIGHHSARHCKGVYNITTGEIYASVTDAANALGVTPASVSIALDPEKKRTCQGVRLCFLDKILENFEEINEQNRIRTERDRINAEKIAAYDADVERRNAIAKAQEKYNQQEANVAELRRQLEAAETDLNLAKYDLLELKNGH